jgi:4-diphosphocytidyl-2-C-methyl-D-erythritol kinase
MISNPNVKINLGLNVLRKREDGFHDLETLFVPYHGICDTLEIIVGDDYSRTSAALFSRYGSSVPSSQGSQNPEGVFGVERPDVQYPKMVQGMSEDGKLMITIAREEGVDWNPLKDLTAKAYQILSEDFQMPPVKIFLEKTSPVGAGLGGGSADAAATLRLLNQLWKLKLKTDKLEELGARLGADVPFLVRGGSAFAEGIGEKLTFIKSLQLPGDVHLLIATPHDAVPTKDAYAGVPKSGPDRWESYKAKCMRSGKAASIDFALGNLYNAFESSVFPKHPLVEEMKNEMKRLGAKSVLMSGSGASVFGVFETRAQAKEAAEELKPISRYQVVTRFFEGF